MRIEQAAVQNSYEFVDIIQLRGLQRGADGDSL